MPDKTLMTGDQHAEIAERLLEGLKRSAIPGLETAQVHATLALAMRVHQVACQLDYVISELQEMRINQGMRMK